MDHVEPEPGTADWEADRRGESAVAADRVVNDKGEPEQSTATIVEERPGTDEEGTR